MAFLVVSIRASDEATLNKLMFSILKFLDDIANTDRIITNKKTINIFLFISTNNRLELTTSIINALLENVKKTAPKVTNESKAIGILFRFRNKFIKNKKNKTKKAPAKFGSRNTENILYICSSHPK